MFNSLKYSVSRYQRQKLFRWIALLLMLALFIYLLILDFQLRSHFSGARWELPSRVYARPLELYSGKQISQQAVERELKAIGYHPVEELTASGQFRREGRVLEIMSRAFEFPDGQEPARHSRVTFRANRVVFVESRESSLELLRLEPMFIGAIYPQRKEDRILLNLEDVPPLLIDLLLTVEDRDFYQHVGIKPTAIARALLVNLKAGRAAQGGSTITQQLVKNLYLSNEKTIWRKAREAILSLMLEFHYEKQEILEAYLNEVYLGQDGARAIHGFGMASYFYFSKPLNRLEPSELMLLVGMVKGPSAYNPERAVTASLKRWQTVYDLALENKLLVHSETYTFPTILKSRQTRNRFPHFIQLVKRQLSREYNEKDLRSAGLRIYSTLDPQHQWQVESITRKNIKRLQASTETELQSATILTSRLTGEVLAAKGGNGQYDEGFNRLLDARRPVGSLLKPAIYLTGLMQPDKYHLATLLDDTALTVDLAGGKTWQPQNYDMISHGQVPLFKALADSYNIASVRLGMDLGIDNVIETLQKLGLEQDIRPYPSLLLGAVELSPLEILTMYQTLANSGYYTPLKAIRYVSSSDGELLNRYPLDVERRVDSASSFLISGLLGQVVRSGTGKSAYRNIDQSLDVAGKTGTTDQLRDSWFAGYSQNYVLVNWIGNDQNRPVGLTGASGALKIWSKIIGQLETESLNINVPDTVAIGHLDIAAQMNQSVPRCREAVEIPYHVGYKPAGLMQCESLPDRLINNTRKWLQKWF